MIINQSVIPEKKGVSFGEALRKFIHSKGKETAEIREKYVKELLNRPYDDMPNLLGKIFLMMKQEGIGIDYELYYNAVDHWDDFDQQAKKDVAKAIWSGQGGKREGAGRKPIYKELGKKIQVAYWLAPDVVEIIRQQPNQAEFIESAIRDKKSAQ